MSAAVVAAIISATVALFGVVLSNSLRRKARQDREVAVISKRVEVYPELWKATESAAPMVERVGPTTLSAEDRDELYAQLHQWYWTDQGGAYLGEPSRTIYLRAKENLRLGDDALWPPSCRAAVKARPGSELQMRSDLARRQLSLLHVAMRAEMGIVTRPYPQALSNLDKDFLRSCGARLWRRPWWDGTWRTWVAEQLRRRPEPLP